jgi:tetratricopeptide (TPR) repeat protein
LKRYSAAATDARRAIALAPTFGKAHARLGQSLYFLKDYEGAVIAYEDAIDYEPGNQITSTYLDKAKMKMHKQKDKALRSRRGDEVSVLTEDTSVQPTVAPSVATDPNASAAVVQSLGFRGRSNAMALAVGQYGEEDPDFDEALRIQERANSYLANKRYKYAIEEYTAALFLVPDDDNLSPDLHLGRAHALNGSRRHKSAKIDATLALKIKATPEAYSTLAKSLFYMKDYEGSIDAFGDCQDLLPEGESLSMFDRAYLKKSQDALHEVREEGEWSPAVLRGATVRSGSAPVPKLPPPRFVPREEVCTLWQIGMRQQTKSKTSSLKLTFAPFLILGFDSYTQYPSHAQDLATTITAFQ